MCRAIVARVAEFYEKPENERRFEEWKSSRERGGAPEPASMRRAPERPATGPVTC